METPKIPELPGTASHKPNNPLAGIKFIVFSFIGIFAFFAPLTVKGVSSIPLDHIVVWLIESFPSFTAVYALFIILAGALYPFVTKTWNESRFEIAFSLLKVLGLGAGVLIFFNIGPAWLLDPNMGPFLYYELIVFIGYIVPLGGLFLTFLIGYGFLEFAGVLFQKVMRPIWKVPGRSAVNALASRVASLVVVYLMTNKEYKEGKYTVKEAVIIASGFITVEATFLIIIARTVDIMSIFYLYFLVTMLVTFLVTAITVRIWPINKMSDDYHGGEGKPEEAVKEKYFQTAWNRALDTAGKAPSLGKNLWAQFLEAMSMTMSVLPAILSIGLIGLVLAQYTPIFDYLGYMFFPFTWLLQIPDALLAAKAVSLGITEILLPALVIVDAELITRFIVAVVSVSSILFFSTSIPSIMATEIPVTIPQLLIIWLERVILSFIIVTPIAFLLL